MKKRSPFYFTNWAGETGLYFWPLRRLMVGIVVSRTGKRYVSCRTTNVNAIAFGRVLLLSVHV